MMRKTYKSKKDTGGGLDPRDMLLTVDEKSSAFDAFYIQNIKQTKRELSSIGSSNHHGVATNRIRKRKLVKRVVKEVEPPPREPLLTSVFLTPDKSIRVNKVLDPFDQLLNSSPVWLETKKEVKEVPFDSEKETKAKAKTYRKKKTNLVKKFNYSSSTNTDKENSTISTNNHHNTTDIKSHQLQIEKEATPSPKIDDSINKFVENLSLIKNLKKTSLGGVRKSKHRLTMNLSSPLPVSPLSSTPMNNKKRSKSIFKLSPIPLGQLDSPNCGTINEEIEPIETNKSIILVPKNITNASKIDKSKSPKLSVDNSQAQKSSKPLFSSQEMESLQVVNDNDSIQKDKHNIDKSEGNSIYVKTEIKSTKKSNKELGKSLVHPNDMQTESHEITFVQTSEVEPFIDFDKDISNVEANKSIIIPLTRDKRSKSSNQKSINASSDKSTAISLKAVSLEGDCDDIDKIHKDRNVTINDESLVTKIAKKIESVCEDESCYTEPIDSSVQFAQNDNNNEGLVQKVAEIDSVCNEKACNIEAIEDSIHVAQSNIMNDGKVVKEIARIDCTCEENPCNDETNDKTVQMAIDLSEISGPFLGFEVNDDIHSDDDSNDNSVKYDNPNSSESDDSKQNYYGFNKDTVPVVKNQSFKNQSEFERDNTNQSNDSINNDQNNFSDVNDSYSDSETAESCDEDSSGETSVENNNLSESYAEDDCFKLNDDKSYENIEVKRTDSETERSYDEETLNSQDEDKESLYDTCDSEQSFEDRDEYVKTPIPVVALERLDSSIFQEYYNKMPIYDIEKSINRSNKSFDNSANSTKQSIKSFDESKDRSIDKSSEESFVSFDTHQASERSIDSGNDDVDDPKYDDNFDKDPDEKVQSYNITAFDIDTSANINDNEERCFITTRRRNDGPKEISILVLNDTNASISSADAEKTILSNKCTDLQESDKDIDIEIAKTDNNIVITDENKENCNTDRALENSLLTEINNESDNKKDGNDDYCAKQSASSKISLQLTRISENTCKETSIDSEIKPCIVLQPGKKWERCLSIYRRMTLANEHCNESILDEDLRKKGRKYRESVISLMEMQDCKGTPHNDSIQSRRSTFICKPNRSTIRIVKDISSSRISLSSTSTDLDDLQGFLEDCDDTIAELSKLSLDEHEVTVLENVNDHSRVVATARDYVLRRCHQTEPLLFDECYPDTELKNCRKIGEGVYGEVYLWRAPHGGARVMKVVPIAGCVKVNGEGQKGFHEIIAEIVIAMELSALRAPIAEIERHFDEGKHADQLDLHAVENATDVFNEVLAVRCVFGNYPSRLLDLWELYDETKGSENDNPAVLPVDQQYIVLELANAGEDLESYQFTSAEQAYALFLQVAFGLAVGEEAFQFEHRDLHWGNVLIAPTEEKYATFILRGRSHRVLRRGIAATIIDYSLSRVTLLAGGAPCALYNDLATDESLFEAVGDYQFDVYRLMRDKLGNDWKNFEPYTNILWLHYVVDKMITALRYKRPTTKIHKQYIAKLKSIKNRLLSYGSAVQFVLTDQEF